MDQEVLLEKILSQKVLEEYRSKDLFLDELVAALEESISNWQSIKGIYVSNQVARAAKIEPIFQRRLATIPKDNIVTTLDEQLQIQNLKKALTQFVDYLKSNPLADIASVIFNCDEFHYEVKCGISGRNIHVICVLKGNAIPEVLLRDSAST